MSLNNIKYLPQKLQDQLNSGDYTVVIELYRTSQMGYWNYTVPEYSNNANLEDDQT